MSYRQINLEEITEVIAGQSPPSSTYNSSEIGLPFFQGKADFGTLYPRVRMWCSSPKKVAEEGDILISVRAPVGPTNICDRKACIGRGLSAIRCGNQIHSKFLIHYLRSIESRLAAKCNGSTFAAITQKDLKRILIPLPPLPEQKRIAKILDKADALRQKNQNIIDQYNQLAQSIFLDMFGDPVANPKKWGINKLKDLSTKIASGNTPKGGSQVYVDKGIVFLRSQNVWRNKLVLDDVAYIDEQTHSKMKKTSLKNKDILMTKTGRFNTENSSLGRAAMFIGEDDSANVNGHVYLIRLKENIINEFVLFILTTDSYREHIRRVCVGGIDKRQINKEHLERFPIIDPPIHLQNQFAQKIQNIEKQKELAQQALQQSEDLFQALLQKAFKGKL